MRPASACARAIQRQIAPQSWPNRARPGSVSARIVLGAGLALAALAGCASEPSAASQGTAGASVGPSEPAKGSCEVRTRGLQAPLRLLTRVEYETSLRGVFGDEAVDTVGATLNQLSDRAPLHGFHAEAEGTTGGDVEARFQVADVLSTHWAKHPERLGAGTTCWASAGGRPSCVDELLATLGLRLFRRPLEASEQLWLRDLYDEGEAIVVGDGLRFVVLALLESPHFLYKLETRGTPLAENATQLRLSSFELATRLSFFAWGTAPDETLLDEAEAGALDDASGLASALDRLFADPRARINIARFLEQWLETESLPSVGQGPVFLAGIAGQGLPEAMQLELSESLLSLIFEDGEGFGALYTSNLASVGSPELAKVYDISASAEPLLLDPARRSGLLTRAAILLTGGETTSPVRRGAFIRRKLLCAPLAAPDPNTFPAGAIQPPTFEPSMTSRQRWEAQTSESQCSVCHANLNPFGFALENYDALGRYREEEALIYTPTGANWGNLPIDASVELTLDTEPVRVNGAVELGQALAQSPSARECVARQWLRFVGGREDPQGACLIRELTLELARGAPLLEVLKRLALSPEFSLRSGAAE